MNRLITITVIAIGLSGCGQVSITTDKSLTSADLEGFFRKHKVDGHRAVALKKRSLGDDSYLATIHGYSDNLSVCAAIIAPYNSDSSRSAVPGTYFCEELH